MINIIYEDNHLLVVEKPSGILSQADYTNDMDMLTILKKYLKEKYHKPGNVYLGLVHRLDRMTSGIMVFAKTSKAASRLCDQISNKEFIKKYYAVVKGNIPNNGTLIDYLYKDEVEIKSYVTDEKNGKLAVLDYKKVSYFNNNSLISITLKTGRHHQIRVQFANYGHPLIGDSLYNSQAKGKLMLHAYYISFIHPISGMRVSFECMPSDKRWVKYLIKKS